MAKFISTFLAFWMVLVSVITNDGENKPFGIEAFRQHTLPPAGYQLVFEDNFDGTELDTTKWYAADWAARAGYYSESQVKVHDGVLEICYEHLDDGPEGEGWYSGSVRTYKKFTRGYFEIRCRPAETNRCFDGKPKKEGRSLGWSAFWMMPVTNPYDPEQSKGGINGAEIDMLEVFADRFGRPRITGAVHCSGSKATAAHKKHPDDLDSKVIHETILPDAFNEFHTYGFMWDKENYTYYLDGRKMSYSNWCDGVSTVPSTPIISQEVYFTNPEDTSIKSNYIVDYVKIYQPSDDIQITE